MYALYMVIIPLPLTSAFSKYNWVILFQETNSEIMWRSFFSAGSSAVRAASFVPTKSIPVVTKQIYAVPSTMTRYFSSSGNEDGPTIQDLANSLDLTLTPEQRLYVDKIKKSIRGGAKSPRCKTKWNNMCSCVFCNNVMENTQGEMGDDVCTTF